MGDTKAGNVAIARLRRIAIHEAGHAVVAWRLGVRLHTVTVKPDSDYLGQVRHGKTFNVDNWDAAGGSDDRAQMRLGRRVKILFAGALAEKRAFPRARWRHHANSDFGRVADVIGHVYFDERAQRLWSDLLWLETEWLLNDGWAAVEAVADALMTKRTLTGREARDVILEAFARDPNEVLSPTGNGEADDAQTDPEWRPDVQGQPRMEIAIAIISAKLDKEEHDRRCRHNPPGTEDL